jgi:hypothetical protein
MRVEVVEHNPDAVGIRVVLICDFNHAVNPVSCCPLFSECNGDPPSQRFSGKMEVSLTVAFVVCVDASDRSRSNGLEKV